MTTPQADARTELREEVYDREVRRLKTCAGGPAEFALELDASMRTLLRAAEEVSNAMGDEAMTGRDQREARLRQAADNGDAHAQEMLLASQSTRYIRTPGSHVLAAAGINVQTLADAAGRGDELRALNRVLRGIA